MTAAVSEDSKIPPRRTVRDMVRAMLRALAASVYARIAFVVVAEWLEPSSAGVAHVMGLVLLFAASLVLSRVEGGTIVSGAMVGAFWALFDVLFGLVLVAEPGATVRFLVDSAPSLVDGIAAGLLGAYLSARRLRSDAA